MTTSAIQNRIIEPNTIFIEGGSFRMGSIAKVREQPTRKVTVFPFYLGQYPVTNVQFVTFLNEWGNQKEGVENWVPNEKRARCGIIKGSDGFECIPGLENHPMTYVSWYGAQAYCRWLSEKTGKNYRLPSEAEWEYAAKGGQNKSLFLYSGSNHLKEVGWYGENSHAGTKPVGLKLPNELGLYDMSGNVWEWCADNWHGNYKNAPQDALPWIDDGDSRSRVVRGGSWFYYNIYCRVSFRSKYSITFKDYVGFRVARY